MFMYKTAGDMPKQEKYKFLFSAWLTKVFSHLTEVFVLKSCFL